MKQNLQCLRCGCEINHIKRQKLQLGQTDWIFGDLPNLFAGAMEVDIYSCPDCGKTLFRSRGNVVKCLDEKCGFERVLEYAVFADGSFVCFI